MCLMCIAVYFVVTVVYVINSMLATNLHVSNIAVTIE